MGKRKSVSDATDDRSSNPFRDRSTQQELLHGLVDVNALVQRSHHRRDESIDDAQTDDEVQDPKDPTYRVLPYTPVHVKSPLRIPKTATNYKTHVWACLCGSRSLKGRIIEGILSFGNRQFNRMNPSEEDLDRFFEMVKVPTKKLHTELLGYHERQKTKFDEGTKSHQMVHEMYDALYNEPLDDAEVEAYIVLKVFGVAIPTELVQYRSNYYKALIDNVEMKATKENDSDSDSDMELDRKPAADHTNSAVATLGSASNSNDHEECVGEDDAAWSWCEHPSTHSNKKAAATTASNKGAPPAALALDSSEIETLKFMVGHYGPKFHTKSSLRIPKTATHYKMHIWACLCSADALKANIIQGILYFENREFDPLKPSSKEIERFFELVRLPAEDVKRNLLGLLGDHQMEFREGSPGYKLASRKIKAMEKMCLKYADLEVFLIFKRYGIETPDGLEEPPLLKHCEALQRQKEAADSDGMEQDDSDHDE